MDAQTLAEAITLEVVSRRDPDVADIYIESLIERKADSDAIMNYIFTYRGEEFLSQVHDPANGRGGFGGDKWESGKWEGAQVEPFDFDALHEPEEEV